MRNREGKRIMSRWFALIVSRPESSVTAELRAKCLPQHYIIPFELAGIAAIGHVLPVLGDLSAESLLN